MIINMIQMHSIHLFQIICFSQLLDVLTKISTFLETFNSKFSCIVMWLTDPNFKLLLIEDKMNITLVIN